jgi:hypothetical protein
VNEQSSSIILIHVFCVFVNCHRNSFCIFGLIEGGLGVIDLELCFLGRVEVMCTFRRLMGALN